MAVPKWRGASRVYSLAYKVLKLMAQDGHATPPKRHKKTGRILKRGYVSETMHDLMVALDEGDEEKLKGMLLNPPYWKYRKKVS